MAGRAGRYGIDDAGFVYLIIPEGSATNWQNTFANPRPVNSVLNKRSILAFHVLAEIQNRVITNVSSLLSWYRRSLAGMQSIVPFEKCDAEGLIDDLLEMEMLTGDYMRLNVTGLGKVFVWLYFSPYDVYAWYRNFDRIFSDVRLSDETLAWAIADIPSNDLGYIRKDLQDQCEEWRWMLKNRGINATNALPSVIGAYNCLTGNDDNLFASFKRSIIYDIFRQNQAFELMDGMHAKWNKDKFWKILPARVKYGIPEELAELVKLPGIGGVRAKKLWETGFQSIADIADPARRGELKKALGVSINAIQSAAKKMLSKKED
jgi:replicative superfamily II helicase